MFSNSSLNWSPIFVIGTLISYFFFIYYYAKFLKTKNKDDFTNAYLHSSVSGISFALQLSYLYEKLGESKTKHFLAAVYLFVNLTSLLLYNLNRKNPERQVKILVVALTYSFFTVLAMIFNSGMNFKEFLLRLPGK